MNLTGIWKCDCGATNSPSRETCGGCGKACPVMGPLPKQGTHKAVKTTKLNKAESDVKELLEYKYPGALILSQGLTLTFDDGTSYRADHVVIHSALTHGITRIIEVKGGYRGPGWEQGYERFRRARDVFARWFLFELWEKKNGEWRVI